MNKFKRILKLFFGVFFVLAFIINSALFSWVKFINPFIFKRIAATLASFYCKILVQIFGIEITYQNEEIIPQNQSFLHISNHLGYIDIFGILAKMPLSFITSYEMKERFGVGQLLDMAACSYVERRREKRSKEDRNQELKNIFDSLKSGVSIALYPEATSHNCESILPFKKPMYIPAYEMNRPILASVINFKSIDGEKLSRNNRDIVCWHGTIELVPHLWRFLLCEKIIAEISFLEVLTPNRFNSLEELVSYSEKLITENFQTI